MKWPWSRPEPVRQRADSFAEQVAAAVLDRASGSGSLSQAVAALEIAAGLWSRAFASAALEGDGGRLRPDLLAWMARELVTRGEAVAALEVDGGRLLVLPADGCDVSGGPDPATWSYRLTLEGPTRTREARYPAASVVHVRYGATAAAPWEGVAPWAAADVSANLLAALEGRLRQEAGAPVGHLLPVPQDPAAPAEGDDVDPLAPLKETLRNLRGGLALVETTAGGWSERANAPREDFRPQRIGADPPQVLGDLADTVGYRLLAACGIPPALVRPGADGTASREAWRQFLHGTISPVARLVAAELSEKLDGNVTLDFEALYASDLSGRARAFASMVNAGLDPERAATVAGLLEAGD